MSVTIVLTDETGFPRKPQFAIRLIGIKYIEKTKAIRLVTEPMKNPTKKERETLDAIRKIAIRESHHKSGSISFDIFSLKKGEEKKYELKKGFDLLKGDKLPKAKTWDSFVDDILKAAGLTVLTIQIRLSLSFHEIKIPLEIQTELMETRKILAKKKREAKNASSAK